MPQPGNCASSTSPSRQLYCTTISSVRSLEITGASVQTVSRTACCLGNGRCCRPVLCRLRVSQRQAHCTLRGEQSCRSGREQVKTKTDRQEALVKLSPGIDSSDKQRSPLLTDSERSLQRPGISKHWVSDTQPGRGTRTGLVWAWVTRSLLYLSALSG